MSYPNRIAALLCDGFVCVFLTSFSFGSVAALPVDVVLDTSTHQKIGGRGDNWTLSWAADGSTLVSMDDGDWFSPTSNSYSHTMYRIDYPESGSTDFSLEDVTRLSGYPFFRFKKSCSFGYGLLAVDQIIYSMVSRCNGLNWNQFDALKMLKSSDNGASWFLVSADGSERYLAPAGVSMDSRDRDEYFFYKGAGVTHVDAPNGAVTYYPFVYNTFAQAGQGYEDGLAGDGYVYIYSPDPRHSSMLNIARVPHTEVGLRSSWEYFREYDAAGKAIWTQSIAERGASHELRRTDAAGNPISWYSGLPDVAYNKGLDLWIMVNGSMYSNSYNGISATTNNGSGSLTFLYSRHPYGPWIEIRHIDHFAATSATERSYQPKLDPRHISGDGTEMTLIWSDHAGPFSTEHYTFNQMKFRLTLADDKPASKEALGDAAVQRSADLGFEVADDISGAEQR